MGERDFLCFSVTLHVKYNKTIYLGLSLGTLHSKLNVHVLSKPQNAYMLFPALLSIFIINLRQIEVFVLNFTVSNLPSVCLDPLFEALK